MQQSSLFEPWVRSGLCECGCGQQAPISPDTRVKLGHIKGQPQRFIFGHKIKTGRKPTTYPHVKAPDHPKANNGWIFEHTQIVERALGKHLPDRAEVHHIDRNRQNNAHANLVVCQDHAYHMLLHARQRVVKAGGDPNTQAICCGCKQLVDTPRRGLACIPCAQQYQRNYEARNPGRRRISKPQTQQEASL
jgi:hypothetical protein